MVALSGTMSGTMYYRATTVYRAVLVAGLPLAVAARRHWQAARELGITTMTFTCASMLSIHTQPPHMKICNYVHMISIFRLL